jgi:prepilin-type N-terminal cleavage/methylation domain-containing protein
VNRAMRRTKRRGFTLIELMISLVIASVVVIMLLAIFARISFALREQQQIVTLQRTLSAAREALEYDAQHVGFGMADGWKAPGDTHLRSPIRVINSSSAPDEIVFYYGDPTKQGMVTASVVDITSGTNVTLDANPGFIVGDRILMSTSYLFTDGLTATSDAKIATFYACTLTISSITGTSPSTFRFTDPSGNNNAHCKNGSNSTVANRTMIYSFVSRHWRIDRSTTARQALGVLQLDTTDTGTNFFDQAYGVVDLQAAMYFYEDLTDPDRTADTADPDTDLIRDWYSSTTMATAVANRTALAPTFLKIPLQMSISVVARTAENVEGVFTASSPTLTVSGNTTSNTVGDRASFTLPSATDAAYQGFRVYRYITFGVDLRNMGVGR